MVGGGVQPLSSSPTYSAERSSDRYLISKATDTHRIHGHKLYFINGSYSIFQTNDEP